MSFVIAQNIDITVHNEYNKSAFWEKDMPNECWGVLRLCPAAEKSWEANE